MAKKAKRSRDHHYLPQMYLKGFADNSDKVWVFDRQEMEYRHQHIRKTAFVKDFYTVRDAIGRKSDRVEKMFADVVEGPCSDVMRKLDRGETNLSDDQRASLALFVVLLRMRNPTFDKQQRELGEKLYRWLLMARYPTVDSIVEVARRTGSNSAVQAANESAERILKTIQDESYKVEIPREQWDGRA
jgi:hypothetical protein